MPLTQNWRAWTERVTETSLARPMVPYCVFHEEEIPFGRVYELSLARF